MFPGKISRKNNDYKIRNNLDKELDLKQLLLRNPYDIYAIVNESLDDTEPMMTTFLVVYSDEFEDNVILYDISRQNYTTFTTDISTCTKGYIEVIDVCRIARYPIKFYVKELYNEIIYKW
ncbi:hypothetical protein [Rossellomorea marisflavi]|uniref:hypothetical protein n=1 Tax=Rossellomorea marisflavi TaxID=189381 RepID=UPI00345C778B